MGNSIVSHLVPTSFTGIILAIPLLFIGYTVATWLYNIFLHPLRKFPGPLLCAASPLPYLIHMQRGDVMFWMIEQHEKYGECVRFTPGELSFTGADAYKDIYAHRKAGRPSLEKDLRFYLPPGNPTRDIVNSDAENHARMRRIFANAFSDRSLKLQEPLFLTYIDKLVQNLRESCAADPDRKYNMVKMYNLTTFDIMGDLSFGEPLGMLDNSDYHPWVSALLAGFRFGVYMHTMRYFWSGFEKMLLKYCVPERLKEQMALHEQFSHERVDRRIEKEDARPDIWGLVLQKDEKTGLTKEEMYANANLFMIGGTETTATTLSGLTWHLLRNPDKLQRLVDEIRGSFESEDDITIERLQALPYLHACSEEGMRMYPAVAQPLPRVTPPGPPTEIDGKEVPAGHTVYVANLCAFRNPNNFVDPWKFAPERWLLHSPESAPYKEDKKHAFHPFSLGPRACLGKNMAYHELRLILTKVLYNFDLSLEDDSIDWLPRQKIWIMWDKGDLNCKVTPVKR